MDEAIACTNLRREFKSRDRLGRSQTTVALNGIDLTVPRGMVYGLLGPNGAGKTTTVRILATLLTPTAGEARVLGFDVMREAKQVRRRIGFVLGGDRGLYGRLTAKENLEYFAALNHMESRHASLRAEELLDLVGLLDRKDTLVEQFSRGMKQRLHLARGLLTDPDVIFMDEPTIGLDPLVAQEVRSVVPDLAAAGKTVLPTTHYMVEADVLCETIALINKGEVVAIGTPSEIKNKISGVHILEVLVREVGESSLEQIKTLPGVERLTMSQEGILKRVTVHGRQGADVRPAVVAALGHDSNVEGVMEREPTLEEAYLALLG